MFSYVSKLTVMQNNRNFKFNIRLKLIRNTILVEFEWLRLTSIKKNNNNKKQTYTHRETM